MDKDGTSDIGAFSSQPSGSRNFESPPPSYSEQTTEESRNLEANNVAASVWQGVPQGTSLGPSTPINYQQPLVIRQAAPVEPLRDVHIYAVPAPTPSRNLESSKWRPFVLGVIFAKAIWLFVDVIKISRNIHMAKSVRRALKNDENYHYDEEAQALHEILHIIHTALVITVTLKCISLISYVVGFYGVLKRKRWFVLISAKINIILDTVLLTIVFTTSTEFSLSFLKVIECGLEVASLVLLLLYYRDLRRKQLQRTSVEEPSQIQLLPQTNRSSPYRSTIIQNA